MMGKNDGGDSPEDERVVGDDEDGGVEGSAPGKFWCPLSVSGPREDY